MDEKKVRSIVSDMLMSFDNMVIPQHRQNGVDSPKINSSDLLPYPIGIRQTNGLVTIPTGPTNSQSGTVQFYDLENSPDRDWGINVALGGIWNPFTIVPSGVGANLSVAQIFANSTPTILIADNVFYDLYPIPEYTNTDGTFTCTTAGRYFVDGGVTFDNTLGSSGFCIITIILEHEATPIKFIQKTQHFSATDLIFSIDISGIIETQATDLLYIQIEQSSGGNLTTLTDENTWLNIQKQK